MLQWLPQSHLFINFLFLVILPEMGLLEVPTIPAIYPPTEENTNPPIIIKPKSSHKKMQSDENALRELLEIILRKKKKLQKEMIDIFFTKDWEPRITNAKNDKKSFMKWIWRFKNKCVKWWVKNFESRNGGLWIDKEEKCV